ncbi:XRE family transcriptional regulator [Ciceribacter ferrooxidans]|uniref:Helix-turn-helix transcriptional regulator n=1 Tax=Ciceribacter ferrooxidans TaxID=2509717 RepID=A0A4Q2SVM2_9HYPH|nr:S24 family peptidase [Ciceribacter ferrooxidans]RYC10146.1 helix-turn-helix transcriptional regulator [Ciceribacter ferrooxidans]
MTSSRKIDAERGERIRRVRTEVLKLSSQEKFAQLLSKEAKGVTRGAVGNWELGKEVGIDSMAAICKVSGVSLDWLAYNRGSMLSASKPALISSFDPDAAADEIDHIPSYSREQWRPGLEGALPELDSKLGAGQGAVGEIISLPVSNGTVSGHRIVAEWVFPSAYLRTEIKASPNHTIVMEVVGDSMTPTYLPGDRVLIDLSQNHFVTDTVYAISDGYSEPQIKRLQRVPFSEPALVRIISDNPALETFTVELAKLTVIGRVCGHIARK